MKRYLEITEISTNKVEHRIDVTNFSERKIERLEESMLTRINERFFINDVQRPDNDTPKSNKTACF